jgi:hypothetical protein
MADTLWSNVITWLLIFCGWYAVHRATLARERRKERRELANSAIEALKSLAIEAREFHTAAAFDEYRADLLRYRIDRIILSLQRSPLSELSLPIGRMVKLRKGITLKNMDQSIFCAQPSNSPVLRDIRSAVDDLVDAIEAARERCWL